MKIHLLRVTLKGEPVLHEFPSIKQCAEELECNPRHIGAMLKGIRPSIDTPYGSIVKVTTIYDQAISAAGAIREHSDRTQENTSLGALAFSRGWSRIKQAVEQAASSIFGHISKLIKP